MKLQMYSKILSNVELLLFKGEEQVWNVVIRELLPYYHMLRRYYWELYKRGSKMEQYVSEYQFDFRSGSGRRELYLNFEDDFGTETG